MCMNAERLFGEYEMPTVNARCVVLLRGAVNGGVVKIHVDGDGAK